MIGEGPVVSVSFDNSMITAGEGLSTARHIASCIALILLISFQASSACAAGGVKGEGGARQDDLDDVVLQLRWRHQFQFAGYYAAVARGFYEAFGLRVDIREGGPRLDALTELMEGRADFGVSNSEILLHRLSGKPVVALAAVFQHSPLVLVALEKTGIRTPHDLVGRRVGVSRSTRDAELLAMLKNEGVSMDDILPPLGGKYKPSMYYDGSADAASAYLTNEPFFLEQKGLSFNVLRPATYGIDFYGDCLFTLEEQIEKHPDRVRRFREASLMGWRYAMRHPQEIVEEIVERYRSKKSKEHLLYEAEKMKDLLLPDMVEMGHMNPGRWNHIAETFVALEMADQDMAGPAGFDLEGFLYDPRPVPDNSSIFQVLVYAFVLFAAAGIAAIILAAFNRRLRLEIRRRDRAEEKLRFQAELMEQIQDNIVATDLEGRIIYVNDAVVRRFGRDRDELLGRKVEVFGEGENNTGGSQREILEQTLTDDQWAGRVESFAADGRKVVGDLHSWVVKNREGLPTGIVGVSTDVTEREESRMELKASKTRYENIFNFSNDAFLIFDENGRVVDVNPAACRMYGYAKEEFKGLSGKGIAHPDCRRLFENLMENASNPDVFPLLSKDVKKDGTVFHVEMTGTEFEYKGERHVLSINRDVTSRVMMESDVQEAKVVAEAANRAKNEFLANLSHEIRTPMNAILGFSEILLEETEKQRHKSYLKSINSSGKTLLSLINDILDLSKIEAGRLDINIGPLRLRSLIEEIRMIFAEKTKFKGLDFHVEISRDVPETVVLDELRVRQILTNLVENAVKFTDRGHVTLAVDMDASRERGADGHSQTGTLIFAVRDTGPGIAEDQMEIIFESFRQCLKGNAKKHDGAGLGLAITKKLVEAMNGTISLLSEEGRGSTFKVELCDLEFLPDKTEGRKESFRSDMDRVRFEMAKVLIVDDSVENRELVVSFLRDSKLLFYHADNGNKALEWLEHFPPPDLILLDLVMPEMDGYQVVEILKSNSKFRNIPVVACTAAVMKEDLEKGGNMFDGFLKKPIERKRLIEELKRFLPLRKPPDRTLLQGGQLEAVAEEKSAELSLEQMERLSRLLNLFEEKLLPEYEDIKDAFYLDDMAKFGRKLEELGAEYGIGYIEKYGKSLRGNAADINIERLEQLLEEFPGMVERLKRTEKMETR